MKRISLVFLLALFCVTGTWAQLTLQPGATWWFDGGLFANKYAEKWEYLGDSTSAVGNIKKIRLTTKKQMAIGGNIMEPVMQNVSMTYFRVNGDTIRLLNDTLNMVIANFSLQVGDSTDSPLLNSINLSIFGNCDEIIRYPARVVEVGTETIMGNSRYYKIKYLAQVLPNDSIFVTRKFTEYNWITTGYWTERTSEGGPGCPGSVDYAYWPQLYCYADGQISFPMTCNLDFFDKMGIEESTDVSAQVSIFPNPGTDLLNITMPEGSVNWKYRILSADGKQLTNGSLVNAQVDISDLAAGLYFLALDNGQKTARITFVKQ